MINSLHSTLRFRCIRDVSPYDVLRLVWSAKFNLNLISLFILIYFSYCNSAEPIILVRVFKPTDKLYNKKQYFLRIGWSLWQKRARAMLLTKVLVINLSAFHTGTATSDRWTSDRRNCENNRTQSNIGSHSIAWVNNQPFAAIRVWLHPFFCRSSILFRSLITMNPI